MFVFSFFFGLCRNKADRVKNTANSVKQALDGARKAQAAATRAIQRARDDIGMTEDRLAQVQLHKTSV